MDPLPTPLPTADGSLTLRSPLHGETYHSHHGALQEARHVFLESSGLAARLARGEAARVLEVGFGTGLNVLVAADAAALAGAGLEVVSLERDPLPPGLLRELGHGASLARPELATALFAGLEDGGTTATLAPGVAFELRTGDARRTPLPDEVDVVFHDAFSPGTSPELWTPAFLARLFASLRPGGVLTTYSAAGAVRRALAEVGFTVERLPGPPGKHHMTRATRPA